MSRPDSEVLNETLQRVIRTETRLMTLGGKLGFDLKADEDIAVDVQMATITLQTLDVPYTSVIKAARRAGLHGSKVKVYLDENNGQMPKYIAEMPV